MNDYDESRESKTDVEHLDETDGGIRSKVAM